MKELKVLTKHRVYDEYSQGLKVLVFPTDHVLWSFGFSLLIWGIFHRILSMMGNLPQILNLNQLFLTLDWFIYNWTISFPQTLAGRSRELIRMEWKSSKCWPNTVYTMNTHEASTMAAGYNERRHLALRAILQNVVKTISTQFSEVVIQYHSQRSLTLTLIYLCGVQLTYMMLDWNSVALASKRPH